MCKETVKVCGARKYEIFLKHSQRSKESAKKRGAGALDDAIKLLCPQIP